MQTFLRLKTLKSSTMLILSGVLSISLHAQIPKDTPAIIEDALSSVVTVAVYKTEYTKSMLGMRGNADEAYARHLDLTNAEGSGSGFVIQNQGKYYVVTNAHVVETASDANESIYVFSITRNKYEVKIKGGDSFYDFAILEFVGQPGKEITTLAFSKTEPRIGEQVYAIGNPLGEYPYTVSDGIVSAKNRARGGITGRYGFLQSTATVIWGNSGGPLINAKGEVVGINSQIAFADDGGSGLWMSHVNFALESAICRRLTDDIFLNDGVVQRAFLGIEASQSYEVIRDYFTFESSLQLIDPIPRLTGILKNGPAEGIIPPEFTGALIKRVNNVEVRNLNELVGELESIRPGVEVTLLLQKDNEIKEVSIKTIALKTEQLESLAKEIFTKEANLKVNENTKGLDFTIRQEDADISMKYKNKKSTTDENYNGLLLGLGHLSDDNPIIWRIKTLGEAGAVLRMFGVTGYCELALSASYLNSNEPDVYTISFSENDNEMKSVVWY